MLAAQGGATLLRRYGSAAKALRVAYPDLQLQVKDKKPARYWADERNCRAFFDNFAKEIGFDPLKLDNWYNVTGDTVAKQGGRSLLNRHNGSLRQALHATYPELKYQDSLILQHS